MSGPRFSVGQSVRLLRQPFTNTADSYTIEQVMPFDGTSFEYRIKGSGDKFMRAAKEHELDEGRLDGPLILWPTG